MHQQQEPFATDGQPDYPGFKPTEAEKELAADLAAEAVGFAAVLADRFETAGSTPMVAASLAAHLMLRAAWQFAGVVCIAVEQRDPKPANFIGLAQDITERTRFNIPAIRAAHAAFDDQSAEERV